MYTNPIQTSSIPKSGRMVKPAFKSRALLDEAEKFISGNIEFNNASFAHFSKIIGDKRFNAMEGIESFMAKVFSNLGNPFSGMVILDNYSKLSFNALKNYLFARNGLVHTGLAQLDYSNPSMWKKLSQMYRFLINQVKMKDVETRPDVAFMEGIKNNNPTFIAVLMEDREMLPYKPNGEISVDVIVEGKNHPNPAIQCLFDDNYLLKKTYNRELLTEEERGPLFETFDLSAMYRRPSEAELALRDYIESAPPRYSKALSNSMQKHNVNALSAPVLSNGQILSKVKNIIETDEENFGLVRLSTINDIVQSPDFAKVQHESLNITGSKILHLLAEIYINPNSYVETKMLNRIIQQLKVYNYNFDITDDFGETALKKAMVAENIALIKELTQMKHSPSSGSSDIFNPVL